MSTLRNSIIFTIVLIFTYIFQIDLEPKGYKSTNEDKFIGAIEPLCTDKFEGPKSLYELSKFELKVNIAKSHNWYENLYSAMVSSSDMISDDFKKTFNGEIVISKDSLSCSFSAKIRISGDWKDHLSESQGTPISSLDIKLQNGNIAGIVDFKLLIPETRNGINEIFVTALMRKLDMLAPRTAFVSAKVNGLSGKYLFQENISKELLESQHRREGPLLEVDESQIWKLYGKSGEFSHNLTFPKLLNADWLQESEIRNEIARKSVGVLSQGLSTNWQQIKQDSFSRYMNPETLASNDPLFIHKNQEFQALLYSLDAMHGLTPHNRRFYFDSIYGALEPIYYDGNSVMFLSKENPITVDSQRHAELPTSDAEKEVLKLGAESLIPKIDGINQSEYKNELKFLGFEMTDKLLFEAFEFIKNRLNHYRTFQSTIEFPEIFSLENFQEFENSKAAFNLVFLGLSDNAEICNLSLSLCEQKLLNEIEIKDLFSGNLKINGIPSLYVSESIEFYKTGNLKYVEDLNILKRVDIPEFGSIYTEGEVEFRLKDRILELTSKGKFDRILVRGLNLSNWSIKYFGTQEKFELPEERFDTHGLTACLTILDSEVKNVSIEITNANCEDGINFIRSKGTVDSLKITQTAQDGLDLDFSDLSFENVQVEEVGNDCLDVSSGYYYINQLSATRCFDKGISVGENGYLQALSVNVNNSKLGVATKDWSTADFHSGIISKVELCLASYRKKQEFGSALIIAPRNLCKVEKSYNQNYSKIEFVK